MIAISSRKLALLFLGFILVVGLDKIAELAIDLHDTGSFKFKGLVALFLSWGLSGLALSLGFLVIVATIFFVVEPLLPNRKWLNRLRSQQLPYPRLSFWQWISLWCGSFLVLLSLMGIHVWHLSGSILFLSRLVLGIAFLNIVNWILLIYLLLIACWNRVDFLDG